MLILANPKIDECATAYLASSMHGFALVLGTIIHA
jgi:hypothetical protein